MRTVWVNAARTTMVETFDNPNEIEIVYVATRETPGDIWSPPVTCRKEVHE